MEEKNVPDTGVMSVLNSLQGNAFTAFCNSFLQTLGLTQVETTLSEDGAVRGTGIIELGSLMSYHFSFVAIQHNGFLSDAVLKEAREGMPARINKGIVLTTGSFSRRAKKQGKAKNQVPIDLIDGAGLIQRLAVLHLGVDEATGEVQRLPSGADGLSLSGKR